MKTISKILTVLSLVTLMTAPAFAEVYTGPVSPDGSCILQDEVVSTIVENTVAGTEVAIKNPLFVVFSNPQYSTYFRVDFDKDGCATVATVIDQVQFDLLKSGT